jgi:solute carrier family 25 carnitine/acylcarnitine transporter 20/29
MTSRSRTLPSPEKVTEEAKEVTMKAASDLVQSLRALIAGGVGGVCAVITGHPFDLVKVRLQTAERGVYSGAMDVVRQIIARGGPMVCASDEASRC